VTARKTTTTKRKIHKMHKNRTPTQAKWPQSKCRKTTEA